MTEWLFVIGCGLCLLGLYYYGRVKIKHTHRSDVLTGIFLRESNQLPYSFHTFIDEVNCHEQGTSRMYDTKWTLSDEKKVYYINQSHRAVYSGDNITCYNEKDEIIDRYTRCDACAPFTNVIPRPDTFSERYELVMVDRNAQAELGEMVLEKRHCARINDWMLYMGTNAHYVGKSMFAMDLQKTCFFWIPFEVRSFYESDIRPRTADIEEFRPLLFAGVLVGQQ